MDFIEAIQSLATTAAKRLEHLQTEEATKNALVMPFINILGSHSGMGEPPRL